MQRETMIEVYKTTEKLSNECTKTDQGKRAHDTFTEAVVC